MPAPPQSYLPQNYLSSPRTPHRPPHQCSGPALAPQNPDPPPHHCHTPPFWVGQARTAAAAGSLWSSPADKHWVGFQRLAPCVHVCHRGLLCNVVADLACTAGCSLCNSAGQGVMHSCRASCMTTGNNIATTCCKELSLRVMSLVEVRAQSWQANARPESTTSTHILASCIPNLLWRAAQSASTGTSW